MSRGSECSEARAVVFEKINLWVAGVDRTHFPTAGHPAPHAGRSEKCGLAKRTPSPGRRPEETEGASRGEGQRAPGRPFLVEPELTTGLPVAFETGPDGRNAETSFGAVSVPWHGRWRPRRCLSGHRRGDQPTDGRETPEVGEPAERRRASDEGPMSTVRGPLVYGRVRRDALRHLRVVAGSTPGPLKRTAGRNTASSSNRAEH